VTRRTTSSALIAAIAVILGLGLELHSQVRQRPTRRTRQERVRPDANERVRQPYGPRTIPLDENRRLVRSEAPPASFKATARAIVENPEACLYYSEQVGAERRGRAGSRATGRWFLLARGENLKKDIPLGKVCANEVQLNSAVEVLCGSPGSGIAIGRGIQPESLKLGMAGTDQRGGHWAVVAGGSNPGVWCAAPLSGVEDSALQDVLRLQDANTRTVTAHRRNDGQVYLYAGDLVGRALLLLPVQSKPVGRVVEGKVRPMEEVEQALKQLEQMQKKVDLANDTQLTALLALARRHGLEGKRRQLLAEAFAHRRQKAGIDQTALRGLAAWCKRQGMEAQAAECSEVANREEFKIRQKRAGNDALSLARLCAWCREHGLKDEAQQSEARALAIAPESKPVREILDYEKDPRTGKWVRRWPFEVGVPEGLTFKERMRHRDIDIWVLAGQRSESVTETLLVLRYEVEEEQKDKGRTGDAARAAAMAAQKAAGLTVDEARIDRSLRISASLDRDMWVVVLGGVGSTPAIQTTAVGGEARSSVGLCALASAGPDKGRQRLLVAGAGTPRRYAAIRKQVADLAFALSKR